MRIPRGVAGLGQNTQASCVAEGGIWTTSGWGPMCVPGSTPSADVTIAAQCEAGGGTFANNVCTPGVPVGYNPATGTVAASNTSGNTNPALPSSSEGLCESQGGTWNGVTCDYSSLCALPLGTYDPDAGNCDYTNLYIAIGGAVLLLLLLELLPGGR